MNSPPSDGTRLSVNTSKPPINHERQITMVQDADQIMEITPLHHPIDERLGLLGLVRQQERAKNRGQCQGQKQGAEDRKRISAGHRTEQSPFRPGHRERAG